MKRTSFSHINDPAAPREVQIDINHLNGKYEGLRTFCESIPDCKLEDLLCCSKIFTNLRNFSVHITKVHRNLQDDINAGNVYVCSKCPSRIYRSQYALGRHYREYHKIRVSIGNSQKNKPAKKTSPLALTASKAVVTPSVSDDTDASRRRSTRYGAKDDTTDNVTDGDNEIIKNDTDNETEKENENENEMDMDTATIKIEEIHNDETALVANEGSDKPLIDESLLPELAPYECGYCRLSYESDGAIKRHLRYKHPLSDYNILLNTLYCDYCKTGFSTMRAFAVHMNRCHIESWTFDPWGRLKGPSDSVLDQLQDQNEDNVEPTPTGTETSPEEECDQCNRMFKSANALRLHKRRSHGNRLKRKDPESSILQATSPGLKVADKADPVPKRSLRSTRPAEPDNSDQQIDVLNMSNEEIEEIEDMEEDEDHRDNFCYICQRQFDNSVGFNVHMTKQHKSNSNNSNNRRGSMEIVSVQSGCSDDSSDESMLSKRVKFLDGRMENRIERTCPICKEIFLTAKDYRDHLQTHNMGKSLESMPQFACPVCSKMFKQHSNMRRHHRIHTGETRFQCSVCSRGFIQKVALQYHMSSVHEGEENDCKICGKIFKSNEDLRKHLGVHTGRKEKVSVTSIGMKDVDFDDIQDEEMYQSSYRCEICPAAWFSQQEFLDRHLLHHQGRQKETNDLIQEIPEGTPGRTCKNCGIHYMKRHVDCLAVLQTPKRVKRTPEQQITHDLMMSELYTACPSKMHKTVRSDDDDHSSDSCSEPDVPMTKQRNRKIPEYFTCERVDGTQCKFQSKFEVVFREHILTHIAEKLRDKNLLLD